MPEMLILIRHGDARVAFDLASVREVLRMVLPSPLPGAPRAIIGALNLRGDMLPVLDLEKRLPAGAPAPGPESFLVVTEGLTGMLAIAVTRVEDLHPLGGDEWRTNANLKGVPFLGLARIGTDVVPVLDPDALLEASEVIALKDALALMRAEATE